MRSRLVLSLAAALVLASAALLTASAAAEARTLGDRKLKVGTSGEDVQQLQSLLSRSFGFPTAIDGQFGPGTRRSVRRYEQWMRLTVNGTVHRAQGRDMVRHGERLRAGSSSYRFGERDLESGDRGRDVEQLQRRLTKMRIDTADDGIFGPATEGSVRCYERWRNDNVDGRVSQEQAHKIDRLVDRGARLRGGCDGGGGGGGGGHEFPVQGPYSFGGEDARFGAPRSGHTHQGQDISAASGTPLVAVHAGVVSARQYQDGGAGHYLVIRGDDGSDSVYMHMLYAPLVAPGQRVKAGQRIGYVGSTGASSGPHLHFELWTPHWYAGGQPYDPLPKLRRWAD